MTPAEVLAEKLRTIWAEEMGALDLSDADVLVVTGRCATRLAEDPAITVRTDMVVERFVVEIHRGGIATDYPERTPEIVHRYLTGSGYFVNSADHRVIVRPYPDAAR